MVNTMALKIYVESLGKEKERTRLAVALDGESWKRIWVHDCWEGWSRKYS